MARNKQPSPKDIHKLLGSDRSLSSRDFYGSFGKATFEKSQERLRFGYKLMSHPNAVKATKKYQLWNLIREYVEEKLDEESLKQRIRIAVQKM